MSSVRLSQWLSDTWTSWPGYIGYASAPRLDLLLRVRHVQHAKTMSFDSSACCGLRHACHHLLGPCRMWAMRWRPCSFACSRSYAFMQLTCMNLLACSACSCRPAAVHEMAASGAAQLPPRVCMVQDPTVALVWRPLLTQSHYLGRASQQGVLRVGRPETLVHPCQLHTYLLHRTSFVQLTPPPPPPGAMVCLSGPPAARWSCGRSAAPWRWGSSTRACACTRRAARRPRTTSSTASRWVVWGLASRLVA